jgi:hypothetical protein
MGGIVVKQIGDWLVFEVWAAPGADLPHPKLPKISP